MGVKERVNVTVCESACECAQVWLHVCMSACVREQ